MARLETKSVSVSPNNEQSTIKTYEQFGWTCTNSQEIYSESTHHETRRGKRYEVHSTTNYVKLTFQRDRDMENYDKIVSLENEYWGYANSFPVNQKKGKFFIGIGVVATILGLLLWLGGGFAMSLILLIPAIAFYVLGALRRKKSNAEYALVAAQYTEKMNSILEEVDPLC